MSEFTDADIMAEALRLAETGLGRVAPNPAVGCIIVKNGEVIAAARTADGGRPHAEQIALEQAGADAKDAIVYVTLEPCCHHGRTLPCTDHLIAAQVRRVIVACIDEDKRVSGQGIKALKDAGIEVVTGILEKEAQTLNEGFFKRIKNYRPMVTLKMATSLDSKIATATGESQWITGEEARASVHETRAKHDAILTGVNTVLADNPLLTTRVEGVEHPALRVILDTQLRFPLQSRMAETLSEGEVWIFTAPNCDKDKKAALEKEGLHVFEMDLSTNGKVSIPFVLEFLAEKGVTRLLVEAGQGVFTSFLKLKVWDYLHLYRAPIIIGQGGLDAFGDLELQGLGNAPKLELISREEMGRDSLEIYKRIA